MSAPELPDRSAIRQWLPEAWRPLLGWSLVALAAVSLFLAWWGVSGQSVVAKQLPYLVSGGFTGVALTVMAAALLTGGDLRRQAGRVDQIERKVDDLYRLLTEEVTVVKDDRLVALPAGTTYHRPDCRLVSGKPDVAPVSSTDIADRHLNPCRICTPDG